MDYLVTGGAGFIGSNAVRKILSQGHSVRVLDDLSTGRMCNIESLVSDIDFIKGDIRDKATVEKAVRGVHHVLHFAALPSVPRSVANPLETHEINTTGFLNVLIAARDAEVESFVFSSSSSVYGDTEVLPKREDMKPMPLSPYAAQKLTGECYISVFNRLYGLNTFALRYFNVFGPRQDPSSYYAAVIPRFINALQKGDPVTIFGDGEQTRDFTFVENVVNANLCCSTAPSSSGGSVYNIACGDRITVNELVKKLVELTGIEANIKYLDPRAGDVRDSQADASNAKKNIGWTPSVAFAEGLSKTVEFYMHEGNSSDHAG